jgi:hypothetical protein
MGAHLMQRGAANPPPRPHDPPRHLQRPAKYGLHEPLGRVVLSGVLVAPTLRRY